MSSPAQRSRVRIRVQRIASLVLGVTSGIVTSANIIIIAEGRWNVLTDGTFGMPPMLALVVDSLPYAPIAAATAVILAGTTGVSATSPPVDAIPRRLPMIVAVIACCLFAGYCVFPTLVIFGWMLVGVIGVIHYAT